MQKLDLNQTLAKIYQVWSKSWISYAESGFNFKTDITIKLSPRYLNLFPCWFKSSFTTKTVLQRRGKCFEVNALLNHNKIMTLRYAMSTSLANSCEILDCNNLLLFN